MTSCKRLNMKDVSFCQVFGSNSNNMGIFTVNLSFSIELLVFELSNQNQQQIVFIALTWFYANGCFC